MPQEPTPLLIFPCNGNGLEALDALDERFEMLGFVDDTTHKQAEGGYGWPVFPRRALAEHPDAQVLAVPGSPQSFRQRRAVIDSLHVDPRRWARVVHPSAHVSPRASLGRNVLIMAGAVVCANAAIGDHVCVLPNTVIHHDARIGDWTLIGSNVTIAGHTTVGQNCYVGSGASLKNGIGVGAGVLVGLGTVVLSDVLPGRTVVGNPHRYLR